MTLWQKDGGEPTTDLPFRDFDPEGRSWTDLANNEEGREACGWTEAPPIPTYDQENQIVIWQNDAWAVVDKPEPQPEPYVPHRISKLDFSRLLTPNEQAFELGLRKQIAELTSAEFADVNNIGYVMVAIVFRQFDLADREIEINHPDTIQGIGVLQQCGMFTAERAARVLAGLPPQ